MTPPSLKYVLNAPWWQQQQQKIVELYITLSISTCISLCVLVADVLKGYWIISREKVQHPLWVPFLVIIWVAIEEHMKGGQRTLLVGVHVFDQCSGLFSILTNKRTRAKRLLRSCSSWSRLGIYQTGREARVWFKSSVVINELIY